jgi:hypothetical protein
MTFDLKLYDFDKNDSLINLASFSVLPVFDYVSLIVNYLSWIMKIIYFCFLLFVFFLVVYEVYLNTESPLMKVLSLFIQQTKVV